MHTIKVLNAYIDAQREYARRGSQWRRHFKFAEQIISSEGNKTVSIGKQWRMKRKVPFGPLIAKAVQKGYAGRLATEDPEPFYGFISKSSRSKESMPTAAAMTVFDPDETSIRCEKVAEEYC